MNGRVRVIVQKEWAELRHRKVLLITMLLLPAVFLIIAFFVALIVPAWIGEKAYNDPDFERAFTALQQYSPGLANLDPKRLFQVLMLRQFLLLLLLAPVMCTMSVAAYSIVGEKISRSLEPLLATPITTGELLLGKSLAAVIPGMALTWVVFGIFTLGVLIFTPPEVFKHVFNATALCIIFILCPLVTLLGLSMAIITSSRSSDPRSAGQVGAVLILPLICLVVSQVTGLFILTPSLAFAVALALVLVDYFVLKAGVALFQRETILTRWK